MAITVIGAYGAAMSLRVPRLPRSGETIQALDAVIAHGGKGSNQAVGASRLGSDVRLVTALGADAYAQSARTMWSDEGVAAFAVESQLPTMIGVIEVDPSGENRIVVSTGALEDLTPERITDNSSAFTGASVCLVSLEIPLGAARAALERGKACGACVVLNPAPALGVDAELLRLADVLTPNESEARLLTGLPDTAPIEEVIDVLHDMTLGAAVIVTLGERGAVVADGQKRYHVPAPKADVVDTTGAGDAFNAALVSALDAGEVLEGAVGLAVAAGSHAVSIYDVIPSLPVRADLTSTTQTKAIYD